MARVRTVLFGVIRYFAKLVKIPEGQGEGLGMNVLVFNFRTKVVEQIPIGRGGQEAPFTDFKYDEKESRLTFVVGGKIEEFPIYEMSEKTFQTMRREDNWANLAKGLRMQSAKTVDWLKKRGIYG